MSTAIEDGTMAKARAQKTTPVRLTAEAMKWARIASGYTGESLVEYVSRIVVERGQADADRLHSEVKAETAPARPKRRKPDAGAAE